jgi:hypothetical protein
MLLITLSTAILALYLSYLRKKRLKAQADD